MWLWIVGRIALVMDLRVLTRCQRQQKYFMEELSVDVWIVRSEKRVFVVSSADSLSALTLTSGVFYREKDVLHVITTESCSTTKGLGRAVLVRSLRYLAECLGHPLIYLYSRPRQSFYLQTQGMPMHPSWLRSYWTSALEEIGYQTDSVGYKTVASEELRQVLDRYPEIVACMGLFEDDPVSRVLQHSASLSLDQVFAILCNSKDLTEGTLIFSRYVSERASSLPLENASLNKGFRVVDPPPGVIRHVLETGSVVELKNYPCAHLRIAQKDLAKKEEVKIIRLKRNK
jgi:hypothetical protein